MNHACELQESYMNYCGEQDLYHHDYEFTSQNTCRMPYGRRNKSGVTAMSLWRTLPYRWRQENALLSIKLDFEFKTDGYVYFSFTPNR